MWKEYKYHDCEKTYACRKMQRISQLIFSGHINTKEEEVDQYFEYSQDGEQVVRCPKYQR